MPRGWWVRRLEDVPTVPEAEPHDPEWYPLQHHFRLTTAGINVYRAREPGHVLVERHDETRAGHEELYFVTAGRARFVLDGEEREARAGTVVVVRDPTVVREAVALDAGTTLLAVGGRPDAAFRSSWRPHHFRDVPRVDEASE
ncbi:MAG: AraC family ligand binding domain-containing protein [Thermoleophilia bacterium]|nr:AraC family ligand binding domain-containing protein [Thermoleophilia bacterium]